jgi:hypothetical protein
MKNKRVLEIDRRANVHAASEKLNFTKHLVGFWRGLEDNQRWKYDELSPVQFLETSKLDERTTDKDELARAEFFWSRRPRFLPAITNVGWLIVALGLPFCTRKISETSIHPALTRPWSGAGWRRLGKRALGAKLLAQVLSFLSLAFFLCGCASGHWQTPQ